MAPKPRVFKSRWFERFARRENLSDGSLLEAVRRAEKGLIDADLGGGVIKQRIARRGQGKSGGYRTIILFRRGERAIFVYGFAKSKRENVDASDVAGFKELAEVLLFAPEGALDRLCRERRFVEVCGEKDE